MSLADLINRFLGVENRVRRGLPIRCVAPLIALETKTGTIIRDTRQDVFVLDFDGWIAGGGPNGEADYPDARYFVRRAAVTPNIAETDKLTFDPGAATVDGNGDSNHDDVITVTNSPELPGNANESTAPAFTASHYLRIGQQVRVRAVYASDGSRHYVMNEPPPAGFFRVDVAYNSGTLGNSTTTPAATYDVKYPAGSTNVIGTNIAVECSRARTINTTIVAGSIGVAYRSGTNVVLWDVNETQTQVNCT